MSTFREKEKPSDLLTTPFFATYRPQHAETVARLIDRKSKVSHRSKFAFFRIPKAASSTALKTLFLCENEMPAHDYDHRVAKTSYARFSELSHRQVIELEERYFKFTIVRNPWSRIASAYLDKIVNASGGLKGGMSSITITVNVVRILRLENFATTLSLAMACTITLTGLHNLSWLIFLFLS